LAKIEGISDVKTAGKTCTFRVEDGVDFREKLAEVAQTNPHMKGYEVQ